MELNCIRCNILSKKISHGLCHKCYMKEYNKKLDKKKYAERSKNYRKTNVGSYNVSKNNALKRNIEWNISQIEYDELRKTKECFYCQAETPIVCGGLDRKDNDIGYLKNNLVPCCTNCNNFKRNFLTFDETIKVIELLKTLRGGKLWT